ncbi:hypothetical protein GCM10017620_04820 [Brevundimonas intermedia]|uniref:Histidine kinase n=1 Tax=Brevundimonas intermedia TaxID=74315 RepID=A0ABQ5T424_9CAUL|nr:hypothetical protein GCM10017620_04820 [Brevundimonas intermedia]
MVEAVRARIAAGPRDRFDAGVLALRDLTADVGPVERSALKALWGRIETATGPSLVTCGGLAQALATDRYGLGARPLSADDALRAVEGGSRAMLDLTSDRPWWGRLLARPELKIVAALPDDGRARPQAFLVSKEVSGPTGGDRTFWVTDSGWSETKIVEALGEAGLVADPLAAAGGLKLFVLTGYVQAEDGRLSNAPGRLTGVIGAAPIF